MAKKKRYGKQFKLEAAWLVVEQGYTRPETLRISDPLPSRPGGARYARFNLCAGDVCRHS